MSSFYSQLSTDIIENPDYIQACDSLFESYINKAANEDYELPIDIQRKLATSVQCFYNSENEQHLNEGANVLSMLLNVAGESTKQLIPIANDVFAKAGDFPNIKLLKDKFPDVKFKVSVFNKTQKELRETLNTVEEISHTLTDYQRNLWEDLSSDNDVITAAPTSTGKTHLILQYLLNRLIKDHEAFAAIVVPTRALISEVAGKLYDIAKSKGCENDIEICTVPTSGPFKEKTLFVMTQERLFEILQSEYLSFNYLFIDEAHNISDRNRGVLLHLTLQKVLEGSNPQIIISMPSQQYQNAFESVFEGVEFSKQLTTHSPVAKILISTKLKGRQIHLSRYGSEKTYEISKKFNGTKLADIAYRLGHGESNIIYRNKTNECEDLARDIAHKIPEEATSPELLEAADYVEKFLHKDFTLASNLKKGVAFHYGPLPGVVRRMIEDLARDGKINYIACTSTLAEGVNLPAKNLFLLNPMQIVPYQEAERLENVRIDNITGRAGRMLEHLAGNIFLVDQADWKFKDYFDKPDEKADKIPTYFKVLNEELGEVLTALSGNYDHQKEGQYTYYTIANKLIREHGGGTLTSTIDAPELALSREQINNLTTSIKSAYEKLKIASFTLEANPTVGYIQQNKLYEFLLEVPNLGNWVVPHPKSQNLYPQLLVICESLKEAGIFLPNHSSLKFICNITKKWIQGVPLGGIIAEQRAYDLRTQRDNPPSCNKSVRAIIKTINTDIRFKLASALRCYHLILSEVISKRRSALSTVKLHTFIEIGGSEERIISLVNLGLSRETAIEIHSVLEPDVQIPSFKALKKLFKDEKLEQLHAVTKKEIIRLLS